MEPRAGGDRRRRQPRDLGAAGRGRFRAADRVRESREPAAGPRRDAASRVRRAHGARRRPRAAAPTVHDRRRAAVARRRRARAACRAGRRAGAAALPIRPACRARARSPSIPMVLLFTLGVSVATGLVFGLAPLLHTRIAGLVAALKEGGARGATGAARHHVRRGLVMAEVALAVMLVIGAGLLLRTVFNLVGGRRGLRSVAPGHVRDHRCRRPTTRRRRRARSCTNGCSTSFAAVPACRPPPACPACRRTVRSTPTTPTSTTTRRRPRARSRTSTTTRP